MDDGVQVLVWVRRVLDVPLGLDLLDQVERSRLAGIVPPQKQRSYAAGHALARRAVANVVGCTAAEIRFDRTCSECPEQHGRPTLPDHTGVTFSLSRTSDYVAVAVSGPHPVGIDIEAVEATDYDGFALVALHPDERADIEADPEGRNVRRAVAWTRKEAALKALGTGLRTDPAFLLTPPSGIRTAFGNAAVTVVDVSLPWPDAVAAVATVGTEATLDVRLR